ncbi:hypothetical protein ID866_8307 [Astraeus odoratus]|nr:hypothetical protein ID866_8307 [Astraeus odoratus]
MSVSSTVTSLSEPFLSPQFSFHPAYPQDSAVELPPISISQAAEDLSGKYRPQADLLRRAGLAAPPVSTASQAFPGIYTNQSHPNHNWCSWGDGSSGTASFFDANRGLPPLEDKDFQSVSRTQLPSAISETFDPEFYIHQSIGSGYRARRPSCDFSDSSSASQSVPSSATSSNVHLPLPGPGEVFDSPPEDLRSQQQSQLMVDAQQRDAMPSSQPSSYPGSEQQRLGQEGGFSSAFGLMTIEDQNALSNMASDGVPFFTNVTMGSVIPHSPNATPMPARQPSQSQQAPQQHYRDRGASLSALHTPGELREFWKAYMREPLSGAGSEGPTINANNSNSQPAQMPTSPSGQRRRVRVSSLPSVTPTAERAYPLLNGLNGGQAEGSRASLHGHADDLRSYEAAVNARSTALNLNLVPRRRGTQPTAASTSPSPSVPGSGRAGAPGSSTADMGPTLSRPSSSSSASSLAHAFGPPPLSGASISLPVPSVHGHGHGLSTSFNGLTRDLPSRESSVASDGTGSSDGEMFRPSFKRLASQTLGPANSKRALVERGAERAGKAVAVAVTDGNGIGASRELLSASNTAPRPIAALPERARPNTAGGA